MSKLISSFQTTISDYAVLLILLFYSLILSIHTKPFLSVFNPFDPSINHEYNPYETVPNSLLLCYSFLLPSIAIVIRFGYVYYKQGTRSTTTQKITVIKYLHNNITHLHSSLLGLASSIAITMFFVCLLKNWIGKPRPDFIGRCKPNYSMVNLPNSTGKNSIKVGERVLYDISICTGDSDAILEGLRSHPSGHAAISFAGLNYLTIWLISQIANESLFLKPFLPMTNADIVQEDHRENKFKQMKMYKFLLLVTPNFLAIWIALTRLQNYKHHPADLFAGSIIGLSISTIMFWKFFGWGKAVSLNEMNEE